MRKSTSRVVALAVVAGAVVGCSRQLLSVVADVPPPDPSAEQTAEVPEPQATGVPFVPADTVRPPIEDVWDPDSVTAMLPRDHAGNIDWVAARRTGVIRPRASVADGMEPPESWRFRFGFDFFFPGPNQTFDAWFPHSTHTEWVACEHCHSRIFRYRGAEIKMADVMQGEYCGECHGKVAFPPQTACERCHRDLPQPPDRAQPNLLLGTIQIRRVSQADQVAPADSTVVPADSTVAPAGEPVATDSVDGRALLRQIDASSLDAAIFPHWVHRIRYQCSVCHLEIFEPRAGANAITMSDIRAGRACGRCHDGRTAFAVSFDSCHRCHSSEAEPK